MMRKDPYGFHGNLGSCLFLFSLWFQFHRYARVDIGASKWFDTLMVLSTPQMIGENFSVTPTSIISLLQNLQSFAALVIDMLIFCLLLLPLKPSSKANT